jgi:hypothetical protein
MLLVVPIFMLWLFTWPLLLNMNITPLNYVLNQQFKLEGINLQAISGENWLIRTDILDAQDFVTTGSQVAWTIQISLMEAFAIFTLSLPLLWIFILVTPEPLMLKLQKFIFATLLLIVVLFLIQWLVLMLKIHELKTYYGGSVLTHGGNLIELTAWSKEKLKIISYITHLLGYITVMFLPAFIWYRLNYPFIRVMLLISKLSTFKPGHNMRRYNSSQ